MALKPTKCKVYVDGGSSLRLFHFKDEDVLLDLWNAVKFVTPKTGFVSGKGWTGHDPDEYPDSSVEGYYTINLSKIVHIEWTVTEIEDSGFGII